MKQLFYKLMLSGFIFIYAAYSFSQIQWTEDGNAFGTATGSQIQLHSISDENGGTFLVWRDASSLDYDILAQWIDHSGTQRWGDDGAFVCNMAGDQVFPNLCSDGSGGIIVTWWDESGSEGNIYAQRLDSNGDTQWSTTTAPQAICTADGNQQLPQIVSDGQNGAIITWIDDRNSTSGLYAQRINQSGVVQWAINGIPIATNAQSHELISDGTGGVYVVYKDSYFDIYAQRINSSGTLQWNAGGVAVVTEEHNQLSPKPVLTSDNQLIVTWHDERTSYYNIYAQKITDDGSAAWTTNGIAITNEPELQSNAIICSDEDGGAIIAWWDQREGDYDIYAQRILSDGSEAWQQSGVPVAEIYGDQFSPLAVSDGAGGAFFSWLDTRKGEIGDIDIYAQHLNAEGESMWDVNGLPISLAEKSQSEHTMLPDLSGGFLVFWDDSRNDLADIYGQSVNDAINFVTPNVNTLWAGSIQQTIEWEISPATVGFASVNLYYSLTGDDDYPTTIATNLPISQTQLVWSVPSIEGSTIHIRIQAIYPDQSVAYSYESDTFSIDNSEPSAFNLISPTNNMSTSPTPTFQWEASLDDLSDITYYQLWIDGALYQDQITTNQYAVPDDQRIDSGDHTWLVKAVNGVGLVTQSSEIWNFTGSFDDVPPAVFHLSSPADNEWKKGESITFSWTASNDGDNELLKYQLWIDNQLAVDNLSPENTSYTLASLSTGQHTWFVVAMDQVLNDRQSEETRTLHVDGNSPSAFDLINPPDNNWISDSTPTFEWYRSNDTETSAPTYQLWIDDNLISSITDTTLTLSTMLVDGYHQWYVIAMDQVNNQTQCNNAFQMFVDTQKPEEFSLLTPSDDSASKNSQLTFTWQEAEDAGCGIDHYQLWVDGTLTQNDMTTTQSNPVSLTQGTHTWYVKTFDHLDHMRQSATFQVTIDQTPPEAFTLVSPADQADLQNNRPEFRWNASSDALTGLQKYQLFINDALSVDNIPATQTSITPTNWLTFGTYTWQVKAVDLAGNITASDTRTLIISNTPPRITSEDTLYITEDQPFTYTMTAVDDDDDEITLTVTDLPSWMSQSGVEIKGTALDGTQDTTFIIIATDGILTDSMDVVVYVTLVNDAPTITSAGTVTATENQPFEYTATATDPDNETITITYEEYPDWLSVSEGTLKGTPGDNAETTKFKVKATDGDKTSTLEVTLTVIQVNDPPEFIQDMPTLTVGASDTLIIELDNYVNDPDHDKSLLAWNYEILNDRYAFIVMNSITRKVFIYASTITQDIQIRFTVSDPLGATASDILTITKSTSGIELSTEIPETIVMTRPYPNPFNPVTIFEFGLPKHANVHLEIYNLLGQLIDTPVQETLSAGSYKYSWTPDNLSSGVYLYVLQIEHERKTGRLIYIQ